MISPMSRARHAAQLAVLLLTASHGSHAQSLLPTTEPAEAAPRAAMQVAPGPPAAAQPDPALGVIIGRVLDRATGFSVPRARVELLSVDGSSARGVLSDSTGRYTFTAVEPNEYVLRAWKAGYAVRATEGLGRLGDSPVIRIQPGTTIDRVDLRVELGGVIDGRVRDLDGQPAAWVVVEAQRP